ncbi:uncharacterized protein LOC119121042 [Syngnathus acus]|uniref:uncharacterized protein LOC119121042 n=1 Tax=Syngnathus acus TaxID=161584 RepID=UPI001885D5B2|nr:uncharacterized protein LOC119121042 [Syngnathus acus]
MYLHLLMAFFANFLPAPVMSATELQCDVKNGWRPYCNYCYLMPKYQLTWPKAERYCVSQKAHLSSLRSEDEMDFLTKLVNQSGSWSAFLGVTIEWRFWWFFWYTYFYNSDGTKADYFRWNEGEPNNHRNREFCVEVRTDGYLNDCRCDTPKEFICKKAKDVRPPPLTCPTSVSTTCVSSTTRPTTGATSRTLLPLCPILSSAKLLTSKAGNEGSCMLAVLPLPQFHGFVVDLLGRLSAGRSIAIRGRAKPLAERISFNLTTANDTHLHLGFRIKDKKIVMSSNLNGTEDIREITADPFPFGPGHDFEIIIQCNLDLFHLTVNGAQQLDFTNRLRNVQNITALKMWRDLSLTDVRLM